MVRGSEVAAQQCAAKAKATGQRCQRRAIAGGKTCTVHGSSTKAAKAAAARKVAEEQAQTAARKLLGLGEAPAVDYREALVGELSVWSMIVSWYRQEIAALERLTTTTDRGESATALVTLHDRASEHLLRVIRACHEARIDQQMLDLARAHADQTDRIIHALLRNLGHDPAEPATRQAVRSALTVVEGGLAS